MNDAVFRALDAVYAEELPTETKQKTVDAIFRAFNVTEGQRIVYMCEKFRDDPEALTRFFATYTEKPRAIVKIDTSGDSRNKTPEPVTPKKRGRPPKSPPSIKQQRLEVKEATRGALTIGVLAQQAVNESLQSRFETALEKIKLPTGVKRQGVGFTWSVEEEEELMRLITSGQPIHAFDMSKDGKNPRFDRTDKAINNKIQDLKKKLKSDADSR